MIEHEIYEAATADLSKLLERSTRSYRSPNSDPVASWTHETSYVFTDGQTVRVNGRSVDDMLIPALGHGYELLTFTYPAEAAAATFDISGHVERAAVLGWGLWSDSDRRATYAITTNVGRDTRADCEAIALPDGRIDCCNGDILASFDDWISRVRAEWIAHLERKAEDARHREEQSKPCAHCGRSEAAMIDGDIPF